MSITTARSASWRRTRSLALPVLVRLRGPAATTFRPIGITLEINRSTVSEKGDASSAAAE